MKMSVYQVDTGATPTLGVATSSAHTSASVTRALMEMGRLALVGKSFICACFPTNMSSDMKHEGLLSLFLITDVDECLLNNGNCEHNCTNEFGAYSCQCAAGYQLDKDGHNCTGDVDHRLKEDVKRKKKT